jgi:hypothetical protein
MAKKIQSSKNGFAYYNKGDENDKELLDLQYLEAKNLNDAKKEIEDLYDTGDIEYDVNVVLVEYKPLLLIEPKTTIKCTDY